MTDSTIAIIPARGGSKGVPRKNVLSLAGKPLIGWTIEAALAAKTIQEVVVSTDDPEIAMVAESFGAGVVWRPENISRDLSSSELALLHTLDTLFPDPKNQPALTVFLQCTAPLTEAEDIDGTVNALIEENADTALAVAEFHYFLWRVNNSFDFVGINHEKAIRKMRQEREPQYRELGAVYVMKTDGFRDVRHRFFGKTAHYVVPANRVLEIDEPVDFQIAQMLLNAKRQRQQEAVLPQEVDLIAFDFDGVFTDDRVIVTEDGIESAACSRADGMGVKLAREADLSMLIISTEANPIVRHRARKLGLDVIHDVADKEKVLNTYLEEHNLSWQKTIYVGNDVNDLSCIRRAGCGVAVANADPSVLQSANLVLSREGGNNAVRELIDTVLSSMKTRSRE